MGAAIAGHLANAGLAVNLLDVTPDSLKADEIEAGLTLADTSVRNRIVRSGFERMLDAKPANLFSDSGAKRIRLGNVEDDFERAVAEADWVLEAIVERPEPKQILMARIENIASPTAVISTNTSGIPISVVAEGRDSSFRRRFLGTHFFNPPRYLHLVEVIPNTDTDPDIVGRMTSFLEDVLGKGVALCKDTPNFIANRMLAFVQSDMLDFAVKNEYSVEEVDALTGALLGRPRTATFRLNDIIGIDVMALVIENLYTRVPEDEDRALLRSPAVQSVMDALLAAGHLGAKRGQGFYKTVVGAEGTKSYWGLDLQRAQEGYIEYVDPVDAQWPTVAALRGLPLPDRLRALVQSDDRAGRLIWHTIGQTLAYASKRIPEITDSVAELDSAMKWGFGWEMGPFETWDALGVRTTVERMRRTGIDAAPWVQEMLDRDEENFYRVNDGMRQMYSPQLRRRRAYVDDERCVRLDDLRGTAAELAQNKSASLFDLGDGVLLAESHGKMNTFDENVFAILNLALERLRAGATGLVIGNQGRVFSAGLNLAAVLESAKSGDFGLVERIVRTGQDTFLALRECPRPVVAAPFQRALGGGAEIVLASDRAVAHAETYMGLVEVGVGLVPGWGGCKEMVRRHVSPHMREADADSEPYLQRVFETIGFAKVSTSAHNAVELGYLSEQDRIVMNLDRLLWEAKHEVLKLSDAAYHAPDTANSVYAAGRNMLAALRVRIHAYQSGGYISEYDAEIAGRLAHVLCGGELSEPAWMDEQYFLDLEREALLTLAGQPKTVERIIYTLKTGKPLRN